MKLAQVSTGDLSDLECMQLQTNAEVAMVKPWHTHSRGRRVGNICWVDDLLETQRDHMYKTIVRSVCDSVGLITQVYSNNKLVKFEIVGVAGDGRCAWRSLLASCDLKEYLLVLGVQHC